MTRIRFMKDRARDIIGNKDPRFRVIRSVQQELARGLYLYTTLIREMGTGKIYSVNYTAGVKGWKKHPIRPFDFDEPLFREVDEEKKTDGVNLGFLPMPEKSCHEPNAGSPPQKGFCPGLTAVPGLKASAYPRPYLRV